MKTKDILLVGAGATIIYLLWRKSQKSKDVKSLIGGIGASTGATTSGATSSAVTSSEPEQVYGLNLPSGMDLPNLTGGTGVATEVAVQQGGVTTTPTPAMATTPSLSIEDALGNGIKPIKSIPNTPCEQKWNEYAQTIRPASQEAYEQMKATFLYQCENPKSYGVSQDVMPNAMEEYQSNMIKNKGDLYIAPATLSANGLNSKGRVINARLYRGVM